MLKTQSFTYGTTTLPSPNPTSNLRYPNCRALKTSIICSRPSLNQKWQKNAPSSKLPSISSTSKSRHPQRLADDFQCIDSFNSRSFLCAFNPAYLPRSWEIASVCKFLLCPMFLLPERSDSPGYKIIIDFNHLHDRI